MNRKEFLQTVVQTGAVAGAALSGLLTSVSDVEAAQNVGSSMSAFRGKRTKTEYTCIVSAKPETAFPLLCPVREYEWIDGWRGELIYSESGVAEDDCIFKTEVHGDPMIWSAIAYEPPRHVEYLAIANPHFAMRLSIRLEPSGTGQTKMIWKHTFTGLSEAGNQHVAGIKPDHARQVCEKLEYFLKTGKKLVGNHS